MAYPTTPSSSSQTLERGRTRYPAHLARQTGARPFLHRRGTSKTYERLEDLLREAGYKETRVFSPEPESLVVDHQRLQPVDTNTVSQTRIVRHSTFSYGIGAFVNFFAAWMPSGTTMSLSRASGRDLAARARPKRQLTIQVNTTPPAPSTRTPSPNCISASSSITIRPSDFLSPPRSASLRDSSSTSRFQQRRRPANQSAKYGSIGATRRPGALRDATNTPLRALRSPTAPGAVVMTSVLCRSAPSSRSSSRVAKTRSPILTLTHAENDPWPLFPIPTPEPEDDDDEDEDDSEVTLAKILAPKPSARRQQSICSLRKHLEVVPKPAYHASTVPSSSRRVESADEEWDAPLPFHSARATKKRAALPTSWASWTAK